MTKWRLKSEDNPTSVVSGCYSASPNNLKICTTKNRGNLSSRCTGMWTVIQQRNAKYWDSKVFVLASTNHASVSDALNLSHLHQGWTKTGNSRNKTLPFLCSHWNVLIFPSHSPWKLFKLPMVWLLTFNPELFSQAEPTSSCCPFQTPGELGVSICLFSS